MTFTVQAFTLTPSYCPIQYAFSTDLPNSASNVVQFNSTTRQITVQSNDLTLASAY